MRNSILEGILCYALTVAEMRGDFRVTIIGAEDPGPLGPGVVATTASWWLWQKLKVCHRFRTVAHGGTNTVVTRVAAADDDDVLALRTDVGVVLELGVEKRLGVQLGEEGQKAQIKLCESKYEPADTPSQSEYHQHRGWGSSSRAARWHRCK